MHKLHGYIYFLSKYTYGSVCKTQ